MGSPARPAMFFSLFLLSVAAFSQTGKINLGKKASWITPVSFNEHAKPGENQNTSFYYLLIDEQENTATQEDYNHYAYVILTNEGIQEMSDLSFDFDPEYQELIFHEIKIHRGGKTIDQLSKDIRTIQREENMDRYLYDGTRTAIINLKDVRVGDVIEYSFTRKGYNPVYKDHISRAFYFDYSVAYDKCFKQILIPSSKAVSLKFARQEIPYKKETKGDLTSYAWSFDRVKASETDGNVPGWYGASNYAMLSDFRSWSADTAITRAILDNPGGLQP